MQAVLSGALVAVFATLLAASASSAVSAPSSTVKLTLLGYSKPGQISTNTEQVAFDDSSKVAYLIGDQIIYVLDLAPNLLPISTRETPQGAISTGAQLPVITTKELPATITDVQFCDKYVAVSAENVNGKTLPGQVLIYSRFMRSGGPDSFQLLANFTVGALPDQIEFSRDCKTLLVSNEGEPSGYGPGEVDPEGSVSVINIRYCSKGRSRCRGRAVAGTVRTATFTAWNDKKAELLAKNIKINGPGSTVAQDLEPEYTTFSEDEKTAFVALQENNAVAVLDVKSATITGIYPLGLKDYSKPQNPLDPSDSDSGIKIANWPVFGMYMPDEMKSFRDKGADFVVMANEGDGRDYKGFEEEARVEDIVGDLDTVIFPNAATTLGGEGQLGRLTIIGDKNAINDPNGDGKYDKILSYGGRSFSIYKVDSAFGHGRVQGLTQVFDSGAQLEQISANQLPAIFNSEGLADTFDKRSDNKGPEPEGIAVGYAPAAGRSFFTAASHTSNHNYGSPATGGKRCLFLTTERLSVVFVYDISDPSRPAFQSIALPPQATPDASTRLLAPEGITYARYSTSPRSSVPIVLVAYEGDNAGGLGVYRVDTVPSL